MLSEIKVPFTLEAWEKNKHQRIVTRQGNPARIICTDKKGTNPIVALVTETSDTGELMEVSLAFNTNGGYWKDEATRNDLFLVQTIMDEFSDFEKTVGKLIFGEFDPDNELHANAVKEFAPKILTLAKNEIAHEMNLAQKDYQNGYAEGLSDGIAQGKKEAMKMIPSWKHFKNVCIKFTDENDCVTTEPTLVKGLINDDDYRLIDRNCMVNRELYCIPISHLKRLPKEE